MMMFHSDYPLMLTKLYIHVKINCNL